jgi:HEAT repeat protein
MLRLARPAFVFALIFAASALAGPTPDPTAALLACWEKGDRPDACAPLARQLTARPREERVRLVSELVRSEQAPARALGAWLAIQTRTAFEPPSLVEPLLEAEDVRVLSYALEYLEVFRGPVHAERVLALAESSAVPGVRAAALRLAPELDPVGALRVARSGLQATSAVVQAAAAGVAGRLKDLDSVDALVRLLSDARRPLAVRLEAVEALRRIGDPAVAPLLYLHLSWPEPMLGRRLVVAFGETADPSLAPYLTDELRGDYSREAIVSLARMKNHETTQALLGLFETPETREPTLHLLYWALGEIKDSAAVPSLLVQLRSEDPDRATRAAEALGNIGSRSALRPLIEQLAHVDARVSDMAAWALLKTTGENFEKDRTQWEAWLEQNPY